MSIIKSLANTTYHTTKNFVITSSVWTQTKMTIHDTCLVTTLLCINPKIFDDICQSNSRSYFNKATSKLMSIIDNCEEYTCVNNAIKVFPMFKYQNVSKEISNQWETCCKKFQINTDPFFKNAGYITLTEDFFFAVADFIFNHNKLSKKTVYNVSQSGAEIMHFIITNQNSHHIVDYIYNNHLDYIYQLAYKIAKNKDDADNLISEFYIYATTNNIFKNYNVTKSIDLWLYIVLKNLNLFLKNVENKHSNIKQFINFDTSSDEENDEKECYLMTNLFITVKQPIDYLLEKEKQQTLISLIEKMPQQHKQLIIMKYFNNLKYNEIAKKLNIPIGSVMSRLFYARQELLKKINRSKHIKEILI